MREEELRQAVTLRQGDLQRAKLTLGHAILRGEEPGETHQAVAKAEAQLLEAECALMAFPEFQSQARERAEQARPKVDASAARKNFDTIRERLLVEDLSQEERIARGVELLRSARATGSGGRIRDAQALLGRFKILTEVKTLVARGA